MQTTTDKTRATEREPASLDDKITQARHALATLNEAAVETEAEAQRWQVAFEREPTAEAHQNLAVWTQKAKNARAAIEKHEAEVLWKLEAERKAQQFKAAAAKYDQQVARVQEEMDAACDAFIAAARRLDGAIDELRKLGEVRLEVREVGYQPIPVRLENFVDSFNTRLRVAFPVDRAYPHTTHTRCSFGSSDAFVVVEINRPAAKVPQVLR